MKFSLPCLALVIAPIALAGCGQQLTEEVTASKLKTVADARLVLPPVAGNPAALYFTLGYEGAGTLVLTGVTIDQASKTVLHDVEQAGGVTMMVDLPSVTLADGESVTFEAGGKHGMAMGLEETVKAGDLVDVTFSFEDGSTTEFRVKVEDYPTEFRD